MATSGQVSNQNADACTTCDQVNISGSMAHVSTHQIVPKPLPQGRQQPWKWVCIVLDTASEGTPNCQACSEDLRTLEYLPCNNDKKLGPTKQCEPDPQCPRGTTARRVLQRRLQGALQDDSVQQGPPRSAVGIRCESELPRTLRCHRPHTLPLLRSLSVDHIIYSTLKGLLQVLVIGRCLRHSEVPAVGVGGLAYAGGGCLGAHEVAGGAGGAVAAPHVEEVSIGTLGADTFRALVIISITST
ncbi:hypothetical protein QR46_2529 [Giardia duodenalis assemblage B]|uniref:Uncharacterized protein n=1 Tax=Giardia duodenalis assemblage B TaxID=1394984 RepID=A0A132NTR0_GIAIN|nr:hypothetical protein QR46_2529 [Giardia intestinalis assemblage B]